MDIDFIPMNFDIDQATFETLVTDLQNTSDVNHVVQNTTNPSQQQFQYCEYDAAPSISHLPDGRVAIIYKIIVPAESVQQLLPDIEVATDNPERNSTAPCPDTRSCVEYLSTAQFSVGGDNEVPSTTNSSLVSQPVTEASSKKPDPEEGASGTWRKPRRVSHVKHGGEFYCEPCKKDFRLKRTLVQHRNQYHSGRLPCRCKTCGKYFVSQDKLNNHVLIHDPKNKKFACSECELRYAFRHDLDRHYAKHHGRMEFKCKHCSYESPRQDHMVEHEQKHVSQGTSVLKRGRKSKKNSPGSSKQ